MSVVIKLVLNIHNSLDIFISILRISTAYWYDNETLWGFDSKVDMIQDILVATFAFFSIISYQNDKESSLLSRRLYNKEILLF